MQREHDTMLDDPNTYSSGMSKRKKVSQQIKK